MGKISLCIFFLLVPMGGAFGGTEGVVSGAQPTETPPDTARILDHPAMVTALDRAPPPENKAIVPTHGDMAMPAVTTADPAESTDEVFLIIYLVVFATLLFVIGFWYCYKMMVRDPERSRLVNEPIEMCSMSSDDEEEGVDGVPSTGSYEAEVLADVSSTSSYEAEVLADVSSTSSYESEAPEDASSTSSYQTEIEEQVPLLCRVQPEAPEDDPSVQGLF